MWSLCSQAHHWMVAVHAADNQVELPAKLGSNSHADLGVPWVSAAWCYA